MITDLRYALRLLVKSPWFTSLTVVVLAGGLAISDRASLRIINEVPGISRVTYDISGETARHDRVGVTGLRDDVARCGAPLHRRASLGSGVPLAGA